MTQRYHLEKIRKLLNESFSDEALRCLCYDTPDFKVVYDRLGPDISKRQLVNQLLKYAAQKGLIETLLGLAEAQNPALYAQYQPYDELEAEGQGPAVAREPETRPDLPPQMAGRSPSTASGRKKPAENRLALIIANSRFDDPRLSQLVTPGRDAEALAAVLSDPAIGGFEVVLCLDEREQVIRRQIARLYHPRKKDDLLLLYYSGHGLKDDLGDLYLAAKDTEVELTSATALEAAYVRRQIDRSNSRRKVIILDCCHSGAFAGAGAKAALGSNAGTGEALAGSGYGRVILTASNAVQYAWEGDNLLGEAATSVFTHVLVQGLQTGAADRDDDGRVSLDEWYDYAYEQVLRGGQARQTPQKWAYKVEGRIIIAQNPHWAVKPADLPPELQGDIESPYAWRREGVVSELRGLLASSDPASALAAREALTRLAGDDSRRVSAAATAALDTLTVAQPVEPTPAGPAADRVASSSAQRAPQPTPTQTPTPPPDTWTLTAPIQLELVRVPAGEFLMGSDPAQDKAARDNEQPQHRVELSEFYIGKYPVTNEQYAAFVRATGRKAPDHWKGGRIPEGKEKHPVVFLNWKDAVTFCEWLKRETGRPFRLPTEAEWEKAARGTKGQLYPWGNTWDSARLNSKERGTGDTTPVGRYSPGGDSPYGAADMCGNVWEWCVDWYQADTYQGRAAEVVKDPAGPGKEDWRVVRGGSYNSDKPHARCASRYHGWGLSDLRDVGVRVVMGGPFPSGL